MTGLPDRTRPTRFIYGDQLDETATAVCNASAVAASLMVTAGQFALLHGSNEPEQTHFAGWTPSYPRLTKQTPRIRRDSFGRVSIARRSPGTFLPAEEVS